MGLTRNCSGIDTFSVVTFALAILAVTAMAYDRENPGRLLQNDLDKINRQLDQLSKDLSSYKYRLSYLESSHNQPDCHALERKLTGLENSVKHLEQTNQLWKSNFRSIKNTFGLLREKVTFVRHPIEF